MSKTKILADTVSNGNILADGAISASEIGTGTLAVANGGTGATTLTGVVKANGTAAFTAGNVSLTSEVTGTLPVANGGTGATSLTVNNVLLGNGTSAVQTVAPGTAGNVLTSNGTTWTSAAAPASAGSITATASGSISSGAAVAINLDGTVGAVTPTNVPLSAGTPADVATFFAQQSFTCSCLISPTTVVAFTRSLSTGYLVGSVGTISGSSITWGTVQTIWADNFYYASCAYVPSVDRICVYGYDSSSNWTLLLISRSGNTLSLVAANQPFGAGSSNGYQSGCAVDASGRLYTVNGNSSYALEVSRFSVTATTIPLQGQTTWGSNETYSATPLIYDPISTNLIAVYRNASGFGTSRVITNNTTTASAQVVFNSGSSNAITAIYVPSIQRIVIVFRNGAVAGFAFSALSASISGTTASFGAVQNLVSSVGGISVINLTFDSTVNVLLSAYTDSTSAAINAATISFSGTTPTLATSPSTLISTAVTVSESGQGLFYSSSAGKSVLLYNNNSSASPPDRFRAVMVTAPGTTFNAPSFVGFSSASYTNGQTATINTVGSASNGQSGLTAGTKYYVQNDGTLSSTATTQPYAGLALSATRILVKG